ncbi:MAG: hypothetical protein IT406_03545 [Candidatus Yanofskybacteria bacterium]|nr:hypothetical protein [Candidatus Yanofskybacteria bacterium]
MTPLNIHPIFVHFPVALLTLAATLELVRFRRVLQKSYIFHTKAFLVIAGTISGFIALQTGELLEHLYDGTTTARIVELHSSLATATLGVFGILSIAYAAQWMEREQVFTRLRHTSAFRMIHALGQRITETRFAYVVSIVGLTLITLTGALGGIIAYGPDIDPVASFIYRLLF